MAVEVRLARLSDEMKEGTISRWLKQVGDPVAKGEPIAEVETEKVIVEIEAPADGVLMEIVAQEQQVIPVNGLLCRIGAAGEAPVAEKAAEPVSAQPAPAPAPPVRPVAPSRVERPLVAAPAPSNVVPMVPPAAMGGEAGRPLATPLARRIARELGIDLTQVHGSGIGGKIVKTDLQGHLAALGVGEPAAEGAATLGEARAAVAPALAVPAPLPHPAPAPQAGQFQDVPHSPLRRTVARRMAESKAEIPHFYMTAEVDVTELLALRQQLNTQQDERKITVNDLMIKAAALTLERVPEVNAAYLDAAVRRFAEAHIGFAVAIEGGLVTPVVRDCHLKSIGRIAAESAGLIERAKARKLQPQELEGGTFTISNLGMFDVVEFAAIINPPQVGILAIARPVERPVVESGRVVVRSRMNVTLSADHRALDGVTAAAFLKAFKEVVERPVRLML